MKPAIICPSCKRKNKFEPALIGKTVVCPACKLSFTVTTDVISDSPESSIQNTTVASLVSDFSVVGKPDSHGFAGKLVAHIRMVSGQEHICSAVLMFEIAAIRRAEQIRQQIEQNLRGFRTGISFWGSFSSAVTRSLLLGLVEDAVSQDMAKTAISQLESYYQACIAMRNSGVWIEIEQIEGIRVPIPQQWRVVTGTDQAGTSGYILSNDPCIAILTEAGVISIMWDKVEDYAVRAV